MLARHFATPVLLIAPRIGAARTRAASEVLAFVNLGWLGSLAARHSGPIHCLVNHEIFLCVKRVTLRC
jgi:hypothetical protein